MRWNYLSIPKLAPHGWGLGIDKQFHLTLCNRFNNLSMLVFTLIHVSKRGLRGPDDMGQTPLSIFTRNDMDEFGKHCKSCFHKWLLLCFVLYGPIMIGFHKCRLIWWSTHWGRDKLAAIFQTTFSNAFSWMKSLVFWLNFNWSQLLRVPMTISQHWFR